MFGFIVVSLEISRINFRALIPLNPTHIQQLNTKFSQHLWRKPANDKVPITWKPPKSCGPILTLSWGIFIVPHTFLFLRTKTNSSSVFQNNSCQDQGLDTFKAYYKNPIVLHCLGAVRNDMICQRLQIGPNRRSSALLKRLEFVFRPDKYIYWLVFVCRMEQFVCLIDKRRERDWHIGSSLGKYTCVFTRSIFNFICLHPWLGSDPGKEIENKGKVRRGVCRFRFRSGKCVLNMSDTCVSRFLELSERKVKTFYVFVYFLSEIMRDNVFLKYFSL